MRNAGLMWGALAVLCGATAQAAPKNAATPATDTAGGAAALPGASVAASAAGAPTSGASTTPEATAPAAAVDGTAAAPDAASTPPVEPTPEADEEAEEERAREAARKKRKRKRKLQFDAEEDEGDDERRAPLDFVAPVTAEAAAPWSLVGSHFMVSVERVTNVLAWGVSEKTTSVTPNSGGFPETSDVEVERSGTDVSFLGSGGVSDNPFAVPRLAFDGMFKNGLTLGGSLSYLVTSSKTEVSQGTSKTSSDEPTTSLFLLAARVGVVLPASPAVGVWLRGGVTRISRSTDIREINLSTGESRTTEDSSTTTLVDLTLDPQLVISPMPHVGITVGAALDIGFAGTQERSNSTLTHDVTASSYGVTAGLVAIF